MSYHWSVNKLFYSTKDPIVDFVVKGSQLKIELEGNAITPDAYAEEVANLNYNAAIEAADGDEDTLTAIEEVLDELRSLII
jgi:ribosome-associated translation inhibitor RaiA